MNSKENPRTGPRTPARAAYRSTPYVGLYITMPQGASYLKFNDEGEPEEMNEVSADSAFLQGGRFQHWFPVAYETEDGGFGLFYGGRTYTLLLDWYNEANECILQEQVTVQRNLADSLTVAQVGNYTYATLADAVAGVEYGQTVTILSDNAFDETIAVDEAMRFTLESGGQNHLVYGQRHLRA